MTAHVPNTVGSIIVAKAKQYGVDPLLALAQGWQESRLNPVSQGDFALPWQQSSGPFYTESNAPSGSSPTSFGIFQLHKGGELGSLSPAQAMDSSTNANVAIRHLAYVANQNPNASPGTIAALAGGPADPVAYASNINRIYNELKAGQYPAGFMAAYDTVSGGKSDTASVAPQGTLTSANTSSTATKSTAKVSSIGFLAQIQSVMNMHGYDAGWLGPLNIKADIVNLGLTIVSRTAVIGMGGLFILVGLNKLSSGMMLKAVLP